MTSLAIVPVLVSLARAVCLLRQLAAAATAEQAPVLARAIAELEAAKEILLENG